MIFVYFRLSSCQMQNKVVHYIAAQVKRVSWYWRIYICLVDDLLVRKVNQMFIR